MGNYWKDSRDEIKRLYKDLPLLKAELKQFTAERQAILESLPSSGVNPRVQTSGVNDSTLAKTVRLQKLDEHHLKTHFLVQRLETTDIILFTYEERRLFKLYFREGRSIAEISRLTGKTDYRLSKELEQLTERLHYWLF